MAFLRFWRHATIIALALALAACAGVQKVEYVTGTSARNLVQITATPGIDIYPAVSPDGAQIAYQRRHEEHYDLWVVDNKTGRGLCKITNHTGDDRNPAWFPDGETLVFDSPRLGAFSLWRKKVVGPGGISQITGAASMDFDGSPSPLDGRIVFTSQNAEEALTRRHEGMAWELFLEDMPHIWMVDPDGSNLTQFGEGFSPTWSPDGNSIAFVSLKSKNCDVWLMEANGGKLRRLTTHKAVDVDPSFSPDGSMVAFASDRRGSGGSRDFNVWVISVDGKSKTQITIDEAYDGGCCWSPDGDIYFHSNRGGDWDIWRITPVFGS